MLRPAEKNSIANASFVCADAADYIKTQNGKIFETVVLNPPRKGCDADLLNTIKGNTPPRIIYISCNPATLARDLALLCAQGKYNVEFAQPVDMFPQTGHVETIVSIRRQDL